MCRWSCWKKAGEPGAHILSGAIMDPKALTELFPDWKELGAPLNQPVTDDAYVFLGESPDFGCPTCSAAVRTEPWQLHREPGQCDQVAGRAGRSLGVEIFPGFAAAEVLYNEDGSVKGVATGNMGVGKDGEPTDNFQLGMELLAKYTVFAEGARGHLGKQLIAKFKLDEGKDPQSFGIGIKELWEIDPSRHSPAL
jgi:electron-transferring-flavoprotein dehydrogenase